MRITLVVLLCWLVPWAQSLGAAERLNVLFIAVDDMNNDLGAYGHPLVKSPHIDRLASRGVRFERAYCQFPLCGPSRASIMTGLRPDTGKVLLNRTHFRTVFPDIVTLPQMFQRQGYHAARVGKVYHYNSTREIGTDGFDDPPSWNERHNPAGQDTREEHLLTNYTPRRVVGGSMAHLRSSARDEELTDGMVATRVIQLLEENRSRPFFIAAGFFRPHAPYIAPARYFDLYPLEQASVPAGPWGYLKQVPEAALDSTKPWPWLGTTQDQAGISRHAYWSMISFVDAQVGRVLDALDRLGLAENTIVVFWSDNGYHLGEHGLWLKQSLFENSARVPLIIAVPGFAGGAASPRTVELLDLYPTLADLCGIEPPTHLEGRSLRPLLENPNAAWDRPAFTQIWRVREGYAGHSVRTERLRYTEWEDGRLGSELYDYETDPEEKRNRIADAQYAGVVNRLRALVRRNWANEFRPPARGEE